uniref:N-alpha-acetyltransferase 80-like n=1 Tax=Styela clava TaxID=7725 RepID=UPI00193A4D70|nr:N-alpha-acetyltransferase 80-like [Styela clava]XP_039254530.1 N-alpha-acetyltransferase 80-like [Styela clava]
MTKSYDIFALHQRLDLIDGCAKLLNAEWKRSYDMRVSKLKRSNKDFPYHIALTETVDENEKLVGHLRLTKVLGEPDSLYMSSVIITECSRGMGLGRKLLNLTEELMKTRGFECFYLRTDSPEFYTKCGYDFCDPIQEVLSTAMENKMMLLQSAMRGDRSDSIDSDPADILNNSETKDLEVEPPLADKKLSAEECNNDKDWNPSEQPPIEIPIPPPPPPPPPCGACKPMICYTDPDSDNECDCNFWLRKHL